MTAYQVAHYFDTDNGFGDAVRQRRVVGSFPNENAAKAFRDNYNDPHVYGVPYDNLMCGILRVEECEAGTNYDHRAFRPDGFWWLHTPRYDAETQRMVKE